MNNIKNNDITDGIKVAGTDFFVDSEELLDELTDSDLGQIVGGSVAGDVIGDLEVSSHLSILACHGPE